MTADTVWRDSLIVFAVAFAARFADWLYRGTRVIGDATGAIDLCYNFSLYSLTTTNHTIMYIGFELPFCMFLWLTDGWIDGWILLQIGLLAVSSVLIYCTGRLLVDRRAGLVAGLMFAVVWQVIKWTVRPQSEAFFTIVGVVLLWRLAHYHLNPSKRNRWLCLGVLGVLTVTRPNGVAVLAGYLFWDTLIRDDAWRLNLFPNRALNVAIIGVATIMVVYRLFTFGGIGMREALSKGTIVSGLVYYEYAHIASDSLVGFVIANALDVAVVVALRFVYFFVPIFPGWSTVHVAVNLLTFLPVVVGGVAGTILAIRRRPSLVLQWGTPWLATHATVLIIWVPGGRNYFGIAAAAFALFSGYLVAEMTGGMSLPLMNKEPVSQY